MAKVKKCIKCKAEIPANAKKCTRCGSKQGNTLRTLLIGAIFLFVVIEVIIGSQSKDTGSAPTIQSQALVKPHPQKKQASLHHVRKEIKEKDVPWTMLLYGLKDGNKYKKGIVRMLNKLANEFPACEKDMDIADAGNTKGMGKPGPLMFFVQCGYKAKPPMPEVVKFSVADIKANRLPKTPHAIDQVSAVEACARAAKAHATNPSSVSFSRVLDLSFKKKPNGTATVYSSFTEKNGFGVKEKFNIMCQFDGYNDSPQVIIKPAN